jgi:hypothetical protein
LSIRVTLICSKLKSQFISHNLVIFVLLLWQLGECGVDLAGGTWLLCADLRGALNLVGPVGFIQQTLHCQIGSVSSQKGVHVYLPVNARVIDFVEATSAIKNSAG